MAAPAKRPKDGQSVSWGEVRIREYARCLSSGGIPEGEPGCKFPLGLCNVVVVRSENGDIAHAVELLTGAVLPPSALGIEDTVSNGESASTAGTTTSATTSNAQDSTATSAESAELADLQQVDRNGSSASNGTTTTEPLRVGSRDFRVGEFVAGSVEQFDVGRDAFKTSRALSRAQGKAGKKAPPAAIVELLKRMEHCDSKQRHKLLLEEPCILRKAELDAECQQLSAEYSVILKERAANNQGCRCGMLTSDSLKMYKRDDLVEECKRRNIPPNGSKAQLMDKLVEHSAANLGCTHRMCTLLARLEARMSADGSLTVTGAGALPTSHPGGSGEDRAQGSARRAEATGVTDPPSPSSVSADSVKSMSETREDEVNVKLARLKEGLPQGSVLALPEDPRQRKAFVRAFLLQDDLRYPDTEAADESKKSSSCPCEAEGVGCHYNTCACDSEACDNRHLWDPTSAVYADRLFELHRAAVHFLNASWQVNNAARDASAGASGGESEGQVGVDSGAATGGFGATGNKAAQAARSKRRKVTGSSSASAVPTNVLHLPGGITIEVPGGMPCDGPFFTAEQVVWTMRVVEHILLADEDEEGGAGEVEEEEEEDGRGAAGTVATTVSASDMSVYSSSVGTHASAGGAGGRAGGTGGRGFQLSTEEGEEEEGTGGRDADSASTEEEGVYDSNGLNTPLVTGRRGRGKLATGAAATALGPAALATGEEGGGARKGRKRKMSSEGEDSDGSASSDAGSGSAKRARGGGRKGGRLGVAGRGAEQSMAAGEAAAAAAAQHGQAHAYHHTHAHPASDPFQPPAHGVSPLEYGLLREVYGEDGLAGLGPLAHDPAMFPVSPAQEGVGVLAVWGTVKGMPEGALSRLAALSPVLSSSQGSMATLAWLELKARQAGSLIAVVDGIASHAALDAGDDGAGWLAAHLRSYFEPADGAAILRRVLHLCSEQRHLTGSVRATKPTSPARRHEEGRSSQASPPSAAFQAEAKQLILQRLGAS